MKTCVRCQASKPLEEFHKNARARDGHKAACADCCNAWARQYYEDVERHDGHPTKERRRAHNASEYNREWKLQKTYGVSDADYQRLLDEQDGLCAVCERHHTEFTRRFAFDHNHKTGKIRGLLCISCNRGIGYLGDDPERLISAAAYLIQTDGVLQEQGLA